MQLAQPDRPVVCVLGEGSAQYAITGFWTAAAYKVPVTFLVLRNEEYAILKWFAGIEEVQGAPGLDLPAVNTTEVAQSYGVPAKKVSGAGRAGVRAEGRVRLGRPEPGRGARCSRGWPSSDEGSLTAELLAPDVSRIAPETAEPAPDRAPDELAAGRRSRFAPTWLRCSAPTGC